MSGWCRFIVQAHDLERARSGRNIYSKIAIDSARYRSLKDSLHFIPSAGNSLTALALARQITLGLA